jgi:hypothetical protein
VARTNRLSYLLLCAACTIVATAVAAAVVLVAGTGSSNAAPTRTQYLESVAAICREYGPQLDKIPPPTDIAIPGVVAEPVSRVLPILKAETRKVRALPRPAELRESLTRWLHLNDQANANLERALRAARIPDLAGTGLAYLAYLRVSDQAKRLGKTIGFPSPPC